MRTEKTYPCPASRLSLSPSYYAPVDITKNFKSRPERRKYSQCMKIRSFTSTSGYCLWSLGHIMKVVYQTDVAGENVAS